MKKLFYALTLAAVIGITSCSNSVDSKIEKINSMALEQKALTEQLQNGDMDPIEVGKQQAKLTMEIGKLEAELRLTEKLSPEQQEDLAKAKLGDTWSNFLIFRNCINLIL